MQSENGKQKTTIRFCHSRMSLAGIHCVYKVDLCFINTGMMDNSPFPHRR